ncbi:MAG: uridylate kinase [Beijerinckiaceae bacterium]|mgnify:CR=1 FL=1
MSGLLVAKIGGGLAGDPSLPHWLEALAAWPGPLVIAPGGGPFAAAVRHAQREMGLNDLVAQKMMLLAQEQFGLALAALRPSPVICASEDELRAAIEGLRIAIWAPARMAGAATDIPATGRLSSDSLSAWLAGKLGAAHLLLVKNFDAAGPVSTEGLSRRDLVDGTFPDFAALARCPISIAGPSALADAREKLVAGQLPGARVTSLRRA